MPEGRLEVTEGNLPEIIKEVCELEDNLPVVALPGNPVICRLNQLRGRLEDYAAKNNTTIEELEEKYKPKV